jgi:dynein heavy chain, axonemal
VEDISDTASKEYTNSNTMARMKEDWKELEFTTVEMDGKSSPILAGEAVEVLQQALDDHIIKTQTMKGSPFAKFMLPEIDAWEKVLMTTSDNLDVWLQVQQVWMALEPVFSSEDIIQQMPKEGRIFRQVDKMWEKLMGRIKANPAALAVVAIDDLGTTLRSCDAKLGEVQKGLSEYLAEKRKAFPRFYFLSDDELLEILSETKDPLRVQPHLRKCFEGVHRLEFDEEKKILAMQSVEGERVAMERTIDPMAAKGLVEVWLLQVEEVMLKSVRAVVENSLKEYTKMPRDKWILSFAGQAVLCISQLFWTQTTEEMMQKGGLQGL